MTVDEGAPVVRLPEPRLENLSSWWDIRCAVDADDQHCRAGTQSERDS
ncbi:hypothetical protein [Micromonospora sp. WMMD1082]|nr:hypothetical protein [Micromonospora sp. WMMD1082]MDG4797939.1 hypothetical protein [Micromonospora sp. WMMD1082]